jgi:hypothetical protein
MKQHWSDAQVVKIDAKPAGHWQKVLDVVAPKTVLRIEAAGEWTVGGLDSSPDGVLVAPVESRALADYPAGALLGKCGGSTSGSKEGTIFAIGSYCIVQTGDAPAPLFAAVNVSPSAALTAANQIELTITEAE